MYKWCILLAASSLIFVGTSLAQEIDVQTGANPETIWGEISLILGLQDLDVSTGDGQGMTEVDSGVVVASGLEILGTDTPLLSGELPPVLGSGDTNSGPIQPIISDPISRLILSEVYFDGTDEWIEITNIGDGNFYGNITLMGVKSTPLLLTNISLLSGESKIFGDNLSQISGNRYIGKTGLSLNLIDTSPINIQLQRSGQVEDVFLVDYYRVNQYNDKKTSFEKVNLVSTRVQTTKNSQTGYTINPGIYFSTGTVTNVSFPPGQSGEDSDFPVSCASLDQRDLIKINEIFLGNEKYPPYIELAVHEDISLNSLSISGNLVATGIEFLLASTGTTLEKNSFVFVSSSGFRNTEGFQSVRNDDFSLVSTGNWLVITIGSGQNRQVMDIVYISGENIGSSYYFVNTRHQCARVFDSVDYFSPGFERKFLKYLSGLTMTKIEYIPVDTGSQLGTGTCLGTGQNDLFSGETQGIKDISGIFQNYTIRIVDVVYDPEGSDTNNEKITLLANNLSGDKTPLDLNSIFRLKVNGTNKTLPRSLPMNTPTTFTKTFGFPNSSDNGQDVVIQLTYGDYIFDTYTYNPTTVEEEQLLTGDKESTGTLLDLSGLHFSITYVLPNPKGSDKAEEIGIKITNYELLIPNLGMSGIDLSQGFSLQIGKTKKKMKGTVYVGQENILSGSLGLVNKTACVSLLYQEDELTKFCYRAPKEGEKIFVSDTGLASTTEEDLAILNSLQLKKIDNTLCIRYQDKSFLCKKIPAGKAAWKTTQEQKLYKAYSSLLKNFIVSNRKVLYYSTPLKQYFDQLTMSKKVIAQGKSYIDIYGHAILVTDLKKQIQILQTTLPGIVALFEGEKNF